MPRPGTRRREGDRREGSRTAWLQDGVAPLRGWRMLAQKRHGRVEGERLVLVWRRSGRQRIRQFFEGDLQGLARDLALAAARPRLRQQRLPPQVTGPEAAGVLVQRREQ